MEPFEKDFTTALVLKLDFQNYFYHVFRATPDTATVMNKSRYVA